MKVYKEIEDDIEYVMIHYDIKPTQEEMIKALDIIHTSKYCKVWWYWEGTTRVSYIYYKGGKVHRENGLAMDMNPASHWYGINGDIFERDLRDRHKRPVDVEIEELINNEYPDIAKEITRKRNVKKSTSQFDL